MAENTTHFQKACLLLAEAPPNYTAALPLLTKAAGHGGSIRKLPAEQLDIIRNQIPFLLGGTAYKRAVAAPGRAKRDGNIQAVF